jgi:hypothetical protein
MPLSKGAFHEKQLCESHSFLGVQLNFCPCFLYLLFYFGEIPCKKSDHKAVCNCLLHANWRREGRTLLLGTSERMFMHIPSSMWYLESKECVCHGVHHLQLHSTFTFFSSSTIFETPCTSYKGICVCVCVCVCVSERERERIGLFNSLVSCEGYVMWFAFEREGTTKVLGEKSVGSHFVHHGLNLDRTQACLDASDWLPEP